MGVTPQAQDPLAGLKDIHLPAPAPWWDIALGWWLLGLLGFVLLAWLLPKAVARLRRYMAQRALRREIARAWQAIWYDYAPHKQVTKLASAINILLKRVLRSLPDTRHAAVLTGDDWLRYLDQQHAQPPSVARLLRLAAYQAQAEASEQDIEALRQWARVWLDEVVRRV